MPCPTAHFLNKSGVKIQEFSARTGTTKLRETAATQEYDEVLGVDLIPFLLLLLSCCHGWGRVDFMDKCFFENFKRITINLVERKPTTLAHKS